MSIGAMSDRRFFHSFPRPKKGESEDATFERALKILAFMKEIGLVLAPELVEWDVSAVSGRAERHCILQRRACFTELGGTELGAHSATFGPIALSFAVSELRGAGATPVIYVPQGVEANALSQISIFCMRGIYHTQAVLRSLENLKDASDPVRLAAHLGMPVPPDLDLTLTNAGPTGEVVAEYGVSATDVHHVLQHVGFNNIPFDHSIGILSVFQNMFYPTDNEYAGETLGYYRQREWRLIAGDINFAGRPIGRKLSTIEVSRLREIDPSFWSREIVVEGVSYQRSALALVYDPVQNWNFFDLVQTIVVPIHRVAQVRAVVGDDVDISLYE
jgi:hypothetical protein